MCRNKKKDTWGKKAGKTRVAKTNAATIRLSSDRRLPSAVVWETRRKSGSFPGKDERRKCREKKSEGG